MAGKIKIKHVFRATLGHHRGENDKKKILNHQFLELAFQASSYNRSSTENQKKFRDGSGIDL